MGRRRTMGSPDAPTPPKAVKKAPAKKVSRATPKTRGMPRKHAPRENIKGYKYDWYTIKSSFVEGYQEEGREERIFLTLKDLAEKLNVPVQRLRERSADERWMEQREQYQLRLAKSRQTRRVLELTGESVEFDSTSLKLAKLGMTVVTARMSEIAREIQERQKEREEAIRLANKGFPIDPEHMRTVIDAKEISTLAAAATAWQILGQKSLGTDIQRLEVQQQIDIDIDVDVEVTTVSEELSRDDPERMAAFLHAAQRAGLLDTFLGTKSDEIIDGEEVTNELEAGTEDDE